MTFSVVGLASPGISLSGDGGSRQKRTQYSLCQLCPQLSSKGEMEKITVIQRHPAIRPCGLGQCEGVLAVCSAASDSLQVFHFRAKSTAAALGINT